MNHYNFEQFLASFERKGKEMYGNHFTIHENDTELLLRLVIYFSRNSEMAAKYDISLDKGLLLNGSVGCGKTSLMTLFRLFLPNENKYKIKSCREISFQFHEQGYSVIRDYSRVYNENNRSNNYCFDDLGAENTIKHFGNECNVMGEILMSRYDKFVVHEIVTHVTTNLTSSEIEEYYGIRVRSRMREMFNLISFDRTTPDKRV